MSRSTRGGFAPLRDLPAVLWLILLVAVSLAHPLIPAPRWLMIHLLLLGAATHSILVWSRHFADALLHTRPGEHDKRDQNLRLGLLNGSVALVLVGVVADVWQIAAVGATGVTGAVGWHGIALARQLRRSLPSRFGATVRYYVAAACCLPVGALLGVLMARGLGDPLHEQVVVAHVMVNLLGWVGLTMLGTLVTLWPTMLRTRIADGAEVSGRRALPILVCSIIVGAEGALLGMQLAVPLGLVGYLCGVALLARPFLAAARAKPPTAFPTLSVLCGMLWLIGCLLVLTVQVATAPTWVAVGHRLDWVAAPLAAGFAAQVLLGAISYLVPVASGGGPSPARAANTVLDRGGVLRIVLVNGGLLVCVLDVPSLVRVLASTLVLGGLASFIPLLLLALRASRKARTAPVEVPAGARRTGPAPVAAERPVGQIAGLAATGFAALVLAVAIGVAVDPSALAGATPTRSAAAGTTATGRTTTVQVHAADMRFTPSTIDVPAGNRLVIELTNTDRSDVHDLVLDSGQDSGRLSPGESAKVDVGVVGRDIDGWCSVVGHRQMGMVLAIHATGAAAAPSTAPSTADDSAMEGMPGIPTPSGSPDGDSGLDFRASPGPGFQAHDATLPSVPRGRVHRRTFTVEELDREIAPGVSQHLWTFNSSAPGPVLHGRVGDRFVITLVNDGTMGHSIDFHAGSLAPDLPMRTIAPGASLVYRFTATRAGIWMYHCSSMPMTAHIANGMFGAVVIDPPGLPKVDRSYVLLQSELYLGSGGGPVDVDKLRREAPDAVVFNGYADQYDHRPLRAKVGERVRVWVLDAGPDRSTSFHVVGGQFDTVFSEGAYLLRPGSPTQGGAQALALAPGQGGFVELTFPEAGHYPFVSHVMIDAERGAHGIFAVTD